MSVGRESGVSSVTIAVSSSEQSRVSVPTNSRPISAARGGMRNQWVKARTRPKTASTTQGAHILRLASWMVSLAIA